MKFSLIFFLTYWVEHFIVKSNIQGYYWRDYCAPDIPNDAFGAGKGKEHKSFFVGQALNGYVFPAQIFNADKKTVYFKHWKKHEARVNVKILCSQHPYNFRWIQTDVNHVKKIPYKCKVFGGWEPGRKVYIGRKVFTNTTCIGKVNDECNKNVIPGFFCIKDGVYYHDKSYQILVWDPYRKIKGIKPTTLHPKNLTTPIKPTSPNTSKRTTVKPTSPTTAKPTSSTKLKPTSPTTVKPTSPTKVKSTSSTKLKPTSPTTVKPTSPTKVKSTSSTKLKPTSPTTVKPTSPTKVKSTSSTKLKPTSPATVKPTSPTKVKSTSSTKVEPTSPSTVKPSDINNSTKINSTTSTKGATSSTRPSSKPTICKPSCKPTVSTSSKSTISKGTFQTTTKVLSIG